MGTVASLARAKPQERDLGPTQEPDCRWDRSQAPAGVDEGRWSPDQAARVLLAEAGWDDEGSYEGQTNLSSVGVPGEGEVDPPWRKHLREVRVVDEEEPRGILWDPAEKAGQSIPFSLPNGAEVAKVAIREPRVLDPHEPEGSSSHIQSLCLVPENRDSCLSERPSYEVGIRPYIVVSEDGVGPARRPERGESREAGGDVASSPRDEIAAEDDQVWPQPAHDLCALLEVPCPVSNAQVHVAELNEGEPVKSLGQAGNRNVTLHQFDPPGLDGKSVDEQENDGRGGAGEQKREPLPSDHSTFPPASLQDDRRGCPSGPRPWRQDRTLR